MVSANEIGSSKKNRLFKKEFGQIKQEIEKYALEKYPELKQELVIGKQQEEKQGKSDKETQVRKRGKTSKVESISDVVGAVLKTVNNEDELKIALAKYGFEYYRRGNTPAILDKGDNKKYRFKRLGLAEAHQAMMTGKQETEEKREKEEQENSNKDKQDSRAEKVNKIDELSKVVGLVLNNSKNEDELKTALKRYGRDYYRRGDTPGVIDKEDNKKYRFNHLGVIDTYNSMIKNRPKPEKEEIIQTEDDKLTAKDRWKEWVLGDFDKRKRLNETDNIRKRQKKKELDGIDIAKEWIFGVFKERNEIKAQKDYERTKDIMDNDPELTAEEKRKEWIQGDFSAREEREKANRIKEWKNKKEQEKKQAEKKDSIVKSREAEMKQRRQAQKQTGDSDSDSQSQK